LPPPLKLRRANI